MGIPDNEIINFKRFIFIVFFSLLFFGNDGLDECITNSSFCTAQNIFALHGLPCFARFSHNIFFRVFFGHKDNNNSSTSNNDVKFIIYSLYVLIFMATLWNKIRKKCNLVKLHCLLQRLKINVF